MRPRLDEAELEWRRILGGRILEAIRNAGLSLSEIAEFTGDNVTVVSRYTRGLRKVPPVSLTVIARVTGVAVEDLLATDGRPLPEAAQTEPCREQLMLEASGPTHRTVMLIICDQPGHDRADDCHDPRGFRWNPDSLVPGGG